MSIVSALLERTLKGLHVYLSAPTQDCGKIILERELSAHLEIMSNALSVSQEFLKVNLIFIFRWIYSSTLLLILLLAIKRYSQFGKEFTPCCYSKHA